GFEDEPLPVLRASPAFNHTLPPFSSGPSGVSIPFLLAALFLPDSKTPPPWFPAFLAMVESLFSSWRHRHLRYLEDDLPGVCRPRFWNQGKARRRRLQRGRRSFQNLAGTD